MNGRGPVRGTKTPGPTAGHSQPTYGLEPVGKGHAAAGFRAVFAPPSVAAGEGAVAAVPAIVAAGVAAFLAALPLGFAFFRADFFFAAFFADFFNDFLFPFFLAAFLFFFFFASFLPFLFLAMTASIKSCET